MKFLDSILGRPPQLPDKPKPLPELIKVKEALDLIAVQVNLDKMTLDADDLAALSRLNSAVARQHRRNAEK